MNATRTITHDGIKYKIDVVPLGKQIQARQYYGFCVYRNGAIVFEAATYKAAHQWIVDQRKQS